MSKGQLKQEFNLLEDMDEVFFDGWGWERFDQRIQGCGSNLIDEVQYGQERQRGCGSQHGQGRNAQN